MASHDSLTLAFITGHPAEAARILERLSAADAADLFAHLPARSAAPVLAAMLPSAAARVVTVLGLEPTMSLLVVSSTQTVVAILRQIPEPRRNKLLINLPTTVAMASRLLLYYPDDSVGAWVDPEIVMLPPETTVSEAIARIESGSESTVEQIFTVNSDQKVLGAIELHILLRVSGAALLSSISQKPDVVLNASAAINAVAKQRGSNQLSSLPVIDRNQRLIGVLRRAALDRALARGQRATPQNDVEPLAHIIARGYWTAFSVLTEASISLLPPAEPIAPDKS